jgi:hypothetical protein
VDDALALLRDINMTQALVRLAPLAEQGYILKPSANRLSVLIAFPLLGIRSVTVESILQAADPVAHTLSSISEGSRP